jgi:hypothetical protein
MTGMRIVGVEKRAKEARAALNRLHWEVDYAIEQGRRPDRVATLDLAECVGILANIVERLAGYLPEEPVDDVEALFGPTRARFVQHVGHFTAYHRIPR